MKASTLIRRAWTGAKASLVEEKFTAEVIFDGKHDIPLMEMANRHRAEGYVVSEEYFTKKIERGFGQVSLQRMVRVTIERGQLEMFHA